MHVFFFFLLSYGLGSIPFGILLTRCKGIDIRGIGSGNIGATNVLRTGQKGIAASTLLLDAFKGFLPTFLFLKTATTTPCAMEILAPSLALIGVLGHVFPVWSRFKGGKGVATAIGTLWALSWELALLLSIVWLGLIFLFQISSLAALVALLIAPLGALGLWSLQLSSFSLVYYTISLLFLLFWTHKNNIKDLWIGQEKTIKLGENGASDGT